MNESETRKRLRRDDLVRRGNEIIRNYNSLSVEAKERLAEATTPERNFSVLIQELPECISKIRQKFADKLQSHELDGVTVILNAIDEAMRLEVWLNRLQLRANRLLELVDVTLEATLGDLCKGATFQSNLQAIRNALKDNGALDTNIAPDKERLDTVETQLNAAYKEILPIWQQILRRDAANFIRSYNALSPARKRLCAGERYIMMQLFRQDLEHSRSELQVGRALSTEITESMSKAELAKLEEELFDINYQLDRANELFTEVSKRWIFSTKVFFGIALGLLVVALAVTLMVFVPVIAVIPVAIGIYTLSGIGGCAMLSGAIAAGNEYHSRQEIKKSDEVEGGEPKGVGQPAVEGQPTERPRSGELLHGSDGDP